MFFFCFLVYIFTFTFRLFSGFPDCSGSPDSNQTVFRFPRFEPNCFPVPQTRTRLFSGSLDSNQPVFRFPRLEPDCFPVPQTGTPQTTAWFSLGLKMQGCKNAKMQGYKMQDVSRLQPPPPATAPKLQNTSACTRHCGMTCSLNSQVASGVCQPLQAKQGGEGGWGKDRRGEGGILQKEKENWSKARCMHLTPLAAGAVSKTIPVICFSNKMSKSARDSIVCSSCQTRTLRGI